MKQKILIVALLLLCKVSFAQNFDAYEKHLLIQGKDTLPYRLLLPVNYDASKKYPLIFFLHGAGERGNDNEAQLMHGAKLFLNDEVRTKYPAIVVFPQCPANSFWSNVNFKMENDNRVFIFQNGGQPTFAMKMAQDLLMTIVQTYPVKRDQVYVVGLSMGGMGTFEMVNRNSGLFAAAIPICGGGSVETAKYMAYTKWRVFHGEKDNVVPPNYSEEMVKALKDANAIVKFTLYPEVSHNSWDPAFAEPGLLAWLFSQHK